MTNDSVRQSFDRCEATGDFAERFYEAFLHAAPDVASLFAQTDFEKQRKLLRGTVYIMVTRTVDDPTARETLGKIGRSHSRSGLDIRPELYEVWLDSVCEAVQLLDPEATPDLDAAWREQLRPGIDLITALY